MEEFYALDTQNKNRLYIRINCSVCNNEFTTQKRQLNQYVTCSRSCTNIAKGATLLLICDHCNNPFLRAKSKLLNSKSGKVFCCRECKDIAQTYMEEIQPDHYGTAEIPYREKALNNFGAKCNRCGYDANIKALHVHHKDRNRNNDVLENLEVLCANCHYIEHST